MGPPGFGQTKGTVIARLRVIDFMCPSGFGQVESAGTRVKKVSCKRREWTQTIWGSAVVSEYGRKWRAFIKRAHTLQYVAPYGRVFLSSGVTSCGRLLFNIKMLTTTGWASYFLYVRIVLAGSRPGQLWSQASPFYIY